METKRFSQEDLVSGMPNTDTNKKTETEKKEQDLEKEVSQQKTSSNSGKKVAATVGAVGGAAVGASAMTARDYFGSESDDNIEETEMEEKEAVLSASKSESSHHDEMPTEPGPEPIYLGDDENPTVWTTDSKDDDTIFVNLNPNEDAQAEIEIKTLGEGQGNVMEVDLNGDLEPDVKIYTGEDGMGHIEILNSENVSFLNDLENPAEEPVAIVSDDPDDLFAEEPVIPSDLDNEGNLLAHGMEGDGTEPEPYFLENDEYNGTEDDIEVNLGIEDIA